MQKEESRSDWKRLGRDWSESPERRKTPSDRETILTALETIRWKRCLRDLRKNKDEGSLSAAPILRRFSEELSRDKQVVLAALQGDSVLSFASEELTNDKAVVRAAMEPDSEFTNLAASVFVDFKEEVKFFQERHHTCQIVRERTQIENDAARVLQNVIRGRLILKMVKGGRLVKAGRMAKGGHREVMSEDNTSSEVDDPFGCFEAQDSPVYAPGSPSSQGSIQGQDEAAQVLVEQAGCPTCDSLRDQHAKEMESLNEELQMEVEEGLATYVELVGEKEKVAKLQAEVVMLRAQLAGERWVGEEAEPDANPQSGDGLRIKTLMKSCLA